MTKNDPSLIDDTSTPNWFWGIAIGIIISWISFYIFVSHDSELGLNEQGDAFGALNTLFSGFAFLGVIYAILLQRKELKLQRDELGLTRKELSGSKKALQEQNKTQEIQRFENTFFNLLSNYTTILKELQLPRAMNGENNPRKIYNEYYQRVKNFDMRDNDHRRQYITNVHDLLYKERARFLCKLFHFIEFFITYIEDSKVEDKRVYYDILKSNLSAEEAVIFFYNGFHGGQDSPLKSIFEKYAFFEDMDFDLIQYKMDLHCFYGEQAFGARDLPNATPVS